MDSQIHSIFFIAGIGILTAVIHSVLKNAGKEEFANWATLFGIVVILLTVLSQINDLFNKVRDVFLSN